MAIAGHRFRSSLLLRILRLLLTVLRSILVLQPIERPNGMVKMQRIVGPSLAAEADDGGFNVPVGFVLFEMMEGRYYFVIAGSLLLLLVSIAASYVAAAVAGFQCFVLDRFFRD